ncbi:unnamed protein product [Clonostachys chloroleuca]|uniref:Uncharacterized protein n=1 Tax=Clonostachys chloroleuca TaxID=1926264 RepID=A0AA35LVA9_9HYPO|nr:unnamed protein product [Clonostachys chloroleuca]
MSSLLVSWARLEPAQATLFEKFIPYIIATFLLYLIAHRVGDKLSKLPEINPRNLFEITDRRRLAEFITRSKSILINGRAQYPTQPYRAYTDWGDLLIIPPEYVDEVKNDSRLNFNIPVEEDSHAYVPGFDPFKPDRNVAKLINRHLTKALGKDQTKKNRSVAKLVEPISMEAAVVMQQVLTDSPEGFNMLKTKDWHGMNPQLDIMRIVARMSSRVFMGEELCRDEEWIRASSEYTYEGFKVADTLRAYPRPLRPIIHWFMPSCWQLRQKLDAARTVLKPHIDRRKKLKAEALARGETVTFDDSIEWFEKEYSEGHDPATSQISLSLVAIHTTTDLLQQTMIDIALYPELLAPLREEVIRVFSTDGLSKVSLYKLVLMDSVIKESQRMRPVVLGMMRRQAMADITLRDGFVIKKGTRIIADVTHMWDTSHYEDPDKYDGYRFLKMRQDPELEKRAHLVSTSESHLGFGHGQHACPGRFFAANEIKIALAHLLIKYDWKLPDEFRLNPTWHGMMISPDPKMRMFIRRRKEEIDISCLS